MARVDTLTHFLSDVATAIRGKTGKSDLIKASNFDTEINSIKTGGEPERKDVIFYDYDGTIVKVYSAENFLELGSLPPNPTHEGLTAQGWNWNLNDAKQYVRNHGVLNIGQNYITDDGKTRIYITLQEGRLDPYLGFGANGTVTINWGDGSNEENVVGGNLNGVTLTQHTYSAPGDYVITLYPNNCSIRFHGSTTYGSRILSRNVNSRNQNACYYNAIRKIESGINLSFGGYACFYCSALESVSIATSTVLSGNTTGNNFANCNRLKFMVVPPGTTFIKGSYFSECNNMLSTCIPNGVTSLEDACYNSCDSIDRIIIPDSVTSMGTGCFYECMLASTLQLPPNITSIPNSCFRGLKNIHGKLVIPSGVTSVGTDAFYGCNGITEVVLPNSLTLLNNTAFYLCGQLQSINIPSSVTSIGSASFMYCGLENVEILASATTIQAQAFRGNSVLKNISLSNNLTTLNSSAFADCTTLASITMPSSVTTINSQCFNNCNSLRYIDFSRHASVPTLANTNAFQNLPSDYQILVPTALYNDWIAASNWSSITDHIVAV